MSQIFNHKNQKFLRQTLRRNLTVPEILLWNRLKANQLGFKFRRQYGIGNYIVDFYCPSKKLVVEIDGNSHFAEAAIEDDKLRDQNINALGIKVLRFTNNEIKENAEGVIIKITEILNQPPQPLLEKEGKEL